MGPVQDEASQSKRERLNIRTTADTKALVERAASIEQMTTSEFVMRAAVRSAQEVLADQNRFMLPPDAWKALTERLDRPARSIPELERLLKKPSHFRER